MTSEVLSKLTPEEQETVKKILAEYTRSGQSQTLKDLYDDDFAEIPVSIDEFIESDEYAGWFTNNGKNIFPYWREKLRQIFDVRNNFSEIVLGGCLTGDTLIPLLNGKSVTMKELAEIGDLDEYVYSFDTKRNEYTVGHLIQAFCTGIKKVYKITLDNGKSIKATSNHKFIDSNITWISIDNGLEIGTLLLPSDGCNELSVVSIEYVGEEYVYDLTVEEYHNFVTESGIVAHNSIGCGKSTIAVIGLAYTLYWTMCLKDPNLYFGLGRGDTIFVVFFNATLQLSKGVAFNKFQSLLQHSPWFMARGTVTGTKYLEYVPNKTENSDIKFTVGSQPEHSLGKAILCLDGKTRIYTEKGVRSLKTLEGQFIRVYTKCDDGTIKLTDSPVEIKKTGTETELVEIELEDGCILRCTYDHKLKLTSGEYVEAKDLTEGMDLDSGNCKTSGVYCITNLINGKKYIGKSDDNVLIRLRHHMQGKKSNRYLQDSIKKYGIENFRFEILELCDKSICGQRERYWIEKLDTFKNGYNHTTGGEGESGWHLSPEAIEKTAKVHRGKILSEHTKKLLSDAHKGIPVSEENKKKFSKMFSGKGNPFYGKHHTEETKQKLSKIHKNTPKSTIDKLSNFKTKDNIGRFWINDGVNNKFVHQNVYDNLDQTIWKKGRLFDNKGKVGTMFVNNGHESRQIKLEESEMYFALGWTKGLIKKNRRKKSESKKSDKNNN